MHAAGNKDRRQILAARSAVHGLSWRFAFRIHHLSPSRSLVYLSGSCITECAVSHSVWPGKYSRACRPDPTAASSDPGSYTACYCPVYPPQETEVGCLLSCTHAALWTAAGCELPLYGSTALLAGSLWACFTWDSLLQLSVQIQIRSRIAIAVPTMLTGIQKGLLTC